MLAHRLQGAGKRLYGANGGIDNSSQSEAIRLEWFSGVVDVAYRFPCEEFFVKDI
ncbi:MAG: hypothetical protein WCI18_15035 [Pseudomonadota bacterium]